LLVQDSPTKVINHHYKGSIDPFFAQAGLGLYIANKFKAMKRASWQVKQQLQANMVFAGHPKKVPSNFQAPSKQE
jgi:hypothetical protein